MKQIALCLALCLPLAPLHAQEATPETDAEDGLSLMERGAEMLLRDMMTEMEPALDEMAGALAQAEPMLRDLMAMMENVANYEAPIILPNGDILIRRKMDLVPAPSPEVEL
jgi:hypothetical protein